MAKVKVEYSFTMRNSYSGTVEMEEETFKKLEKYNDDDLCDRMSDYVNLSDPSDWSADCVDVFEVRAKR